MDHFYVHSPKATDLPTLKSERVKTPNSYARMADGIFEYFWHWMPAKFLSIIYQFDVRCYPVNFSWGFCKHHGIIGYIFADQKN